MEHLLTVKEIAQLLATKESWIRRQIFLKKIPHIKIGGLIRFEKQQIQHWIDKHATTHTGETK